MIQSLMNKKYSNLSIMIVDDDQKAVQEIHEICSLFFSSVLIASDGCEALNIAREKQPTIILSDIKMPCMSGLEMIKNLQKESSNSIFILMTAFNENKYLLEAIDLYIDAYFVKPLKMNKLFSKIDTLLERKNIIYKEKNQNISAAHQNLSARELDVFLNIAQGIKPAEIAKKYNLKSKTISTYRLRIFEKMNFKNNSDIIKYSLEHHLI